MQILHNIFLIVQNNCCSDCVTTT